MDKVRLPDADPPASSLLAVKYSYDWLRVWRYVVTQPALKGIGLTAATYSNKRGLQIFPGVARLMAATGYSKPTVIEAMATMRWMGFLWRVSCAQGSNSGKADSYQLCTPKSMEHVPMVDAKSAKDPAYESLPVIAQRAAVHLGVAARLQKASGQLSQPGGQLRQPLVVKSDDLEWWSQLTPPIHLTYSSTKSSDHHSDSHESGSRASSRARDYDLTDDDDRYEYVMDAFADGLDPYEASTVEGMLSKDEHPAKVINKIRSMRSEAA